MPSEWMPGAKVMPARLDGGAFPGDHEYGSHRYGTIHTFEANPHKLSASAGAQYLSGVGYSVHFVLNPVTGEIVQAIPASRAGRGLKEDSNPRTNRAGAVHFQVEVIAFAVTPFTSYWTPAGQAAWARLMAFWASWGVELRLPNGHLAGSVEAARVPGHRIAPGPSGVYGHSDWLDNDHWDPGPLDASLLFAGSSASTTVSPVQRIRMWQEIVEVATDGVWGEATKSLSEIMAGAAMNGAPTNAALVKTIQSVIDVEEDGQYGPKSVAAMKFWVMSAQRWLGVAADGEWGPATQKAFLAAQAAYQGGVKASAPFPLPAGEWFGQDDGSTASHSGVRPADAPNVRRIQMSVGVSADGAYGAGTASAVKARQRQFGVDPDGKVGAVTWQKLFGG